MVTWGMDMLLGKGSPGRSGRGLLGWASTRATPRTHRWAPRGGKRPCVRIRPGFETAGVNRRFGPCARRGRPRGGPAGARILPGWPKPSQALDNRAMKITLKSPADIEKMRVAGRLAAEVLQMIGPHVKAGVSTA